MYTAVILAPCNNFPGLPLASPTPRLQVDLFEGTQLCLKV